MNYRYNPGKVSEREALLVAWYSTDHITVSESLIMCVTEEVAATTLPPPKREETRVRFNLA